MITKDKVYQAYKRTIETGDIFGTKEVPFWHIWNPMSGPIGGFILGCIIGFIFF